MKSTNIRFKQLLYTPKRIFALLNEIIPKSWFQKKWDTFYNNNDSETYINTFIKMYDIK